MTTPNENSDKKPARLERLVEAIHRRTDEIHSAVRALTSRVDELAETSEAIYDAVSYQHDTTRYSPEADYLDGADD